jgi:hypothetical protein
MGCNSHCFIEYKEKDSDYWHSFGDKIHAPRNYTIYALMAGVRDYNGIKLYDPKGIPKDLAYNAESSYYCYIDGVNITESRAESWHRDGAIYKKDGNGVNAWISNPDWHSHTWFTIRELENILNKYDRLEREIHQPEREKQREEILKMGGGTYSNTFLSTVTKIHRDPDHYAMLAAMKSFDSMGYDTRLVVWFDN